MPGKEVIYPRWQNADSIHTGTFLYTEWMGKHGKPYAKMLYNHAKDPQETDNLAKHPEYKQVVKDLAAQLQARRDLLAAENAPKKK